MSLNIKGKFAAVLGNSVLAETPNGALMWHAEVCIEGQPTLRGSICLVKRDGTMMQKNVENLIKILGGRWDGTDLAALESVDCNGVEVVAQVEDGQPNNNGKVFTEVKNIWPPNSGGDAKLPEPVNAKSIAAKYGSQFRATFGGGAKKTPVTKPNAPATKPATPPPSAPKPPAKPTSKKSAEAMGNDAWAKLNAKLDGQGDDVITVKWFELIKSQTGGDDQTAVTAEQWAIIDGQIDGMDAEGNLPF